jgi:hypothetical protein
VARLLPAGNREATIHFEAICTAALEDGRLSINPQAVVVDLSSASPLDRVIYTKVIIPQVLRMAGNLLSGRELPELAFQGFRFGPAVLSVGSGSLSVVANLPGKPVPPAPPPGALPTGGLSMLLSREAMQQVADQAGRHLAGLDISPGAPVQAGGGHASFGVRLAHVSTDVSADPTVINAEVGPDISVSVGVDFLGTAIGLHYDVKPLPPRLSIQLGIGFAGTTRGGQAN